MAVLSSKMKYVRFLFFIFLLLGPHVLFAFGNKEPDIKKPKGPQEPEIIVKNLTDLQDRYNSMSPTIPGMVMLGTIATTIVPVEMPGEIDRELARQLVMGGKIKPISIQKWLTSTYYGKKANNPFTLMNAIKAEHYAVPLQFICKPYIFKCEDYYILHVNFYSLTGTAYPVSVLRLFETSGDIPAVIGAILDEMQLRMYEQNRGANKKRIVVENFRLDFLKLVALDSGEFEFIQAPFINQYGVALRDGDDFFSLLLGYSLASTSLYQVIRPADFSDFAASAGLDSNVADYIIQGRVQLSAELSVLYVTVRDVKNNSTVITIKYPLHDCSLKNIWNAYREISIKITSAISPSSGFGIVPNLSAPERGMYINNMFVGWDSVDYLVLPKGMHQVYTGSYFRSGSSLDGFERPIVQEEPDKKGKKKNDEPPPVEKEPGIGTFYVLLDTMERVFTDREGEYVWNFLKKQ